MRTATIANSIDLHRTQPSVTLEAHVRKRRIELGLEVSTKYKVYLDTRFWILLREVELERSRDPQLIELLTRLKFLVDEGVAICPISETAFVELMKQSDLETRVATAKLMDRLSQGAALIVNQERIQQELCSAVYEQAGAPNLIPLDALVWIKLTHVFGETHPYPEPFDASERLVIQKAFFDYMWDMSLVEMIGYLNTENWDQPDWQITADKLNADNKLHAPEMGSFEKLYRSEFEGGLSLFRQELVQLFKEVESKGYTDTQKNSEGLNHNERFGKFSKSVRTLHIGTCCHAAVRWDQKRQLTGNDLLDFHHAEAAIGYCDLFLTEKSLKALVSQRRFGLLEDFSCAVESTASGALDALGRIAPA